MYLYVVFIYEYFNACYKLTSMNDVCVDNEPSLSVPPQLYILSFSFISSCYTHTHKLLRVSYTHIIDSRMSRLYDIIFIYIISLSLSLYDNDNIGNRGPPIYHIVNSAEQLRSTATTCLRVPTRPVYSAREREKRERERERERAT